MESEIESSDVPVTLINGGNPQMQKDGRKNDRNVLKPSRRRIPSGGGRMIIMLTMTFAFFVVEIVSGYMSNSMALVADSFHMLSDVMALAVAFTCLMIAERSSKNNTFGWVRAEVLGALINGVFLLALCFSIFIESLTRLLDPERIKDPIKVFIVGLIGLVINLIGMFMFHSHVHGHSHDAKEGSNALINSTNLRRARATITGLESQHLMSSHQEGAMALAQMNQNVQMDMNEAKYLPFNMTADDYSDFKLKKKSSVPRQLNMHGVFLHVLSDALGSVIVIITALFSWLVNGYDIVKLYLDPGLSLLMVVILVTTTLPLVRETALILMQTTPSFIEIDELEKSLLKIDGIEAVHEFHVWRLVGERIIATVHIKFTDLRAYITAADEIRMLFHDNSIHSTTIQPEFTEMTDTLGINGNVCALACPPENCKRTDVTCCRRDLDLTQSGTSERLDTGNYEDV